MAAFGFNVKLAGARFTRKFGISKGIHAATVPQAWFGNSYFGASYFSDSYFR